MTMTIEDRATTVALRREFTTEMEIRADKKDGGDSITFDGIASVVDTPYKVRDAFGEFTETIVEGAFAKTLKERDDVRLLKNHDTNFVFARTKSGTLDLTVGPHLRAVAPSLDASNPQVQILRSEMRRGDIDQMSIGFRVTRQEWNEDYTDRQIRELQLFDVSVVTFPASPTTTASLRALDEAVRVLTDGQDYEPDMIRRAIAVLTSRLPEDAEEERDELAEMAQAKAVADFQLRAFLARHTA